MPRGILVRLSCVGIVIAGLTASATSAAVAHPVRSASTVTFGAKLSSSVQPTSNPAEPCSDNLGGSKSTKCTWVLQQAFREAGKQSAPRNGTIQTIKVVAGAKGSFVLQIVQVTSNTNKKEKAKLIANGPTIHYTGAGNNNGPPYTVESFTVNVPVKKGQSLAISTASTATLNCSGGGDNTLLFSPPLVAGQSAKTVSGDDGCFLLISAIEK